MSVSETTVQNLIQRSCLTLDNNDYDGYLGLLSDGMRYRVVAYSEELRKEMVWLDHDQGEMKHLFKMLPKHVTLQGSFFRHVVPCSIQLGDQGWRAISSLMLVHTDLDGNSKLMAVGRYHDEFIEQSDQLRLARREVRLETRVLGPGLHVPI